MSLSALSAPQNGGALAIGVFQQPERDLIIHVRQLSSNSTGDVDFDRITMEHNVFAEEGGLLPTG